MTPNAKDATENPTTPVKGEGNQRRKLDWIFEFHENPWGMPQHAMNRLIMIPEHFMALYMTYLTLTNQIPVTLVLFEILWAYVGGLGTTVGCHRYWSHKTFKAKLPLQYLLMLMQTSSFQYPIFKWCLDHRIHHKYTDTDADPHNSKRGFWYCHMGWLFVPRSNEFLEVSKTFDMPDLESDPVVRFQSRHFWKLAIILHWLVPITLTSSLWELSLFHAICSNGRRHVLSLHGTWTVNSLAHMFGDKPYDKNITAKDNPFVALVAVGEGWHNYHHTFPWDYKASEFGAWKINPSTLFIEIFAAIGWAYDLKTVSQEMLRKRLHRTGNDSTNCLTTANRKELRKDKEDFDYYTPNNVTEWMKEMEKPAWGWDDTTIPDEFRNVTKIL